MSLISKFYNSFILLNTKLHEIVSKTNIFVMTSMSTTINCSVKRKLREEEETDVNSIDETNEEVKYTYIYDHD